MSRSRRFELKRDDPGYPLHLAELDDAPAVLYGVGDPGCLEPGLAVVGARKATVPGLTAARRLSRCAAEAGYVVVSGAAIGCDQEAHRGALEAGATTVAVLPGGVDITYPRDAGPLLSEIADSGAVVSEHKWGTEPKRWTFRTRNRIIAGLSRAVLVVEARIPSGTFSTADYAADAGREVWAVPGSIYAPECRGPNRLIRQGATPITDASDLILELTSCVGPRAAPATCTRWIPGEELPSDPVADALRSRTATIDDLVFATGIDAMRVSVVLGKLEAAGHVRRGRDGRYGVCR